MALKLQRLGIQRVRPLAGGIEAWKELGFPVTALQAAATGSLGGAVN